MKTATLTLTDFLLARIAEDERDGPWHMDWCGSVGHDDSGCDCTGRARLLAESEAKRRIIDLHFVECYPDDEGDWYVCDGCSGDLGTVSHPAEVVCPTLRHLALPYADHPDYRDDWRP